LIAFATPAIPLLLWGGFLYVGHFWENHFAPRTIPEYEGISLDLEDGQVLGIAVGFQNDWPKNFYIQVNRSGRKISDLKMDDVTSLGMEKNPSPLTSAQFAVGTIPKKSFANFDAGRLSAFYGCHPSFQFSNSPDGPFFSLPISFDEYQKMFGKPLRWRREKAGRLVP
jgi:hypothetical protein